MIPKQDQMEGGHWGTLRETESVGGGKTSKNRGTKRGQKSRTLGDKT